MYEFPTASIPQLTAVAGRYHHPNLLCRSLYCPIPMLNISYLRTRAIPDRPTWPYRRREAVRRPRPAPINTSSFHPSTNTYTACCILHSRRARLQPHRTLLVGQGWLGSRIAPLCASHFLSSISPLSPPPWFTQTLWPCQQILWILDCPSRESSISLLSANDRGASYQTQHSHKPQ